ncbi:hypothetical protein [Burkholderia sp. HI2500]|uniref:hypothetical protein n=1 Tax=Burkholderia sp. HI2500 TaxID=2015358 RepID=UPI000B7A6BE3|nr:hypothetical protein [Burkholderia sp. HI2500]OXJ06647.1 hypothetical protein CFB45_37515 [Burkholderia sp. HI2500]
MQTQRFKVVVKCREFPVTVDCFVPALSVTDACVVAGDCATRHGLSGVEVLGVERDQQPRGDAN